MEKKNKNKQTIFFLVIKDDSTELLLMITKQKDPTFNNLYDFNPNTHWKHT